MGAIKRQFQGEEIVENATGKTARITDFITNIAPGDNAICTAHDDLQGFNYGDAHPCVTGLVVTDKRTRPDAQDNQQFIQETIFTEPDAERSAGGRFSMSGSLAAATTTRDRDGAQVVLTYTYPSAPNYKDFTLAGQTRNQIPELEVSKPTLLLRWTRLQSTFLTAWNNQGVLGKVNQLAIWGFPAELLLCTRMEIEQANQYWREIFEFQSTGESWTSYAIFKQEDDNRPVSNPDALAEKDVPVYPVFDYSTLGLLLPS